MILAPAVYPHWFAAPDIHCIESFNGIKSRFGGGEKFLSSLRIEMLKTTQVFQSVVSRLVEVLVSWFSIL